MNVREIADFELDALLDLYRHLHTRDEPLPPRPHIERIWHDIRRNPDLKYFGLFVQDRLAASCTLTIIPNLTRGCRPYGVIENVVTHADFRRRGCGRRMLQHALDHAWTRNCYKVMLMTGRKDDATYRFYESVGFDCNAKQAFLATPR